MKPINDFHAAAIEASTTAYSGFDGVDLSPDSRAKFFKPILSSHHVWPHFDDYKEGRDDRWLPHALLQGCLVAYLGFTLGSKETSKVRLARYDKLLEQLDGVMAAMENPTDGELWLGLREIDRENVSRRNVALLEIEQRGKESGREPICKSCHMSFHIAQESSPPSILKDMERFRSIVEEVRNAGPITERPNTETAHETYFIRRLSAWMTEHFSGPHYAVVSDIANVIFGNGTSADDVKRRVERTR